MKEPAPGDAGRLWREAEPAEVERPSRAMGSVLSVRIPRELLRELTRAARQVGKGPGTLARELIELGLTLEHPASPRLIARVLARLVEEAPELQRPGTRAAGRARRVRSG